MEDTRLKLFELENKLQQAENVSTDAGESVEAKKRADQIIKNAEATAADIIAKAKAQSEKLESSAKPKAEAPKVEPEPAKESASSKFFKKADEDVHTAATSNDSAGFYDDLIGSNLSYRSFYICKHNVLLSKNKELSLLRQLRSGLIL